MKLEVPLVRQKEKSVDCGPAVLSMILQYYGRKASVEDIKKSLKIHKIGTYIPQLGLFLLQNGFGVEIVNLHPKLFTLRDQSLDQEGILERVRKTLRSKKYKKDKIGLRYLYDFLKIGGTVKVKIPSPQDVHEEISKKRPLIAPLTSNFLLGKNPKFNFHFNVITGIDKRYIYVNDPLPDSRGGKHKFPIDTYFFGIYASAFGDIDNASLMKIKYKRAIA